MENTVLPQFRVFSFPPERVHRAVIQKRLFVSSTVA
jgi:hypothetical protein